MVVRPGVCSLRALECRRFGLGITSLHFPWFPRPSISRRAYPYTPPVPNEVGFYGAFGPEIYCFLSQSCFNRARGARRGVRGMRFAAALFVIEIRATTWGTKPRAIAPGRLLFIGSDSNTCFLQYVGEEQGLLLEKIRFRCRHLSAALPRA